MRAVRGFQSVPIASLADIIGLLSSVMAIYLLPQLSTNQAVRQVYHSKDLESKVRTALQLQLNTCTESIITD